MHTIELRPRRRPTFAVELVADGAVIATAPTYADAERLATRAAAHREDETADDWAEALLLARVDIDEEAAEAEAWNDGVYRR